ncbi:MAG: PTS fructose-like transporter subunit EIIC [Planctomycetes bacterium]|nr:PTS fructose-like transporter subunit EIIC [Planctomycetota bacterium]MCH8963744.1 PTS fructose-like transporter subunit EIIC [Planctomycetota bacterium]
MAESLKMLRQHLLTGVSYAIPFIACGGIMIACGIAFVPMTDAGPDFSNAPTMKLILDIGSASFFLLLPVLAGYIAYAMAGRPALVPGFVGGYLAGEVGAGFLGALLIGLVAGWIVSGIKKVPVSKYIRPIMPILIVPIVSSTLVGVLMLKVIGIPIAQFMTFLGEWLQYMSTGNTVVLAMILGAMIAFDMGGPVNKTAFFFGAAMIKEGHYGMMGICAAAICTPPLGLGLATLINRKLWSDEEKESGIAAVAMGMIGITEGAIPFAAADPLRVIPCIMAGSMTAAVVASLGAVGDHAPHGGPIVLPVVDNRIMYVIAIVAGTMVTAALINAVKVLARKRNLQTTEAPA